MGIESFLLFIHVLVTLNTGTGEQNTPKKPATEMSIKAVPETPQARSGGGWDLN